MVHLLNQKSSSAEKITSPEKSQNDVQTRALSERSWTWLLCLICAIIVTSNLGAAALFEPDEGRNAEKAREILLLNDWITPHQNFLPILDKPMPFYWLVASSFKLFGLSEWAGRVPSALAALGCIYLLYRFARRHWGLWEALWSCLVLATSFEFFVFARLVIFDMSLTFFISWALFSFYEAVHTQIPESRRLHALLMYVAMALGTLIKGPIAVIIPGMVIFFYFLCARKWILLKRMEIITGAIIYFAIVTPWYLTVEIRNPGYLRYFLWEEHFIRYFTPHFGRTKDWYYFLMVLGAGFSPWTVLLPFTVRDLWRRAWNNENLVLMLWAVLPLVFFSASSVKLPQYLLSVYPALALLTGRAVAAKLRAPESKQSWILYAVWSLPIGFLLYLVTGMAFPNILPRQIRFAAIHNGLLLAIGAAFLILVFAVFVIGYTRRLWEQHEAGYLCTAVGLAIFLIAMGQVMGTASLRRASKFLAKQSTPYIDPSDRMVFYDTYVEGIPFYLRITKPIWLVQTAVKKDVMGSFYLGERRPDPIPGVGQVLFTFQEFTEQWKRNEITLRVFVKEKNLARLSQDIGSAPKIIIRYEDYLLVTNR